jgi:hypothetical protein
MATIQPTFDRSVSKDGSVVAITWPTMTNAGTDVGAAIQLASFEKTFHAYGTFGAGGNVIVEGSNDGTNFNALSNRQGTAMNFTAAAMNTSQDKPIWVRPRVTAGDGTTSVSVTVACHRSDISQPG